MLKLVLIKNEMTDTEQKLEILLPEKRYDALIEAIVPSYKRDVPLYVKLVNFLFKDLE